MIKVQVNDDDPIQIEKLESGQVLIGGKTYPIDIVEVGKGKYNMIYKGSSYSAYVSPDQSSDKQLKISLNGESHEVRVIEKIDELLQKMGIGVGGAGEVKEIKAPMPGVILEVKINGNSEIKKGDPVFVLEAMKMENVIKSPVNGTIDSVKVKKGDKVEKNEILVAFKGA